MCVLENIHVVSSSDLVDLSGDHIGGRTNADVNEITNENAANAVFEEIPSLIFNTFANLEEFSITWSNVRQIELHNCGTSVRSATISGHSIPVIQNGAFRGCSSLDFLHIVFNGITRIEEDAFVDLPNLLEVSH